MLAQVQKSLQTVTGSVNVIGMEPNGGFTQLRSNITTINTAVTGSLNTLPLMQYVSSSITASAGTAIAYMPFQADVNGFLRAREQYAPVAEDNVNGVFATREKPQAISTYVWLNLFTTALVASQIVKGNAGTLRNAVVRIDSTAPSATYYIQVFNTATVPIDTTGTASMLLAPIKVQHTNGIDSYVTMDLTNNAVYASTGITFVLSSTEFTKTITAAYMTLNAEYI